MPESRRRLYQVGALLLTVAVIGAVAIAVTDGGSTAQLEPGKPVPGSTKTLAQLAGIPQQGITLGNPHAPLTLVEFGDLQCPSCAIFSDGVLPTLVSRYVRPGDLLLVFRGLDFIGPESLRAARMATAIGEQNRLWDFIELMYKNQGAENSGYVTDTYLRALASAIPGVNVNQALKQRESHSVQIEIQEALAQAKRLHLKSTPSFLLSRTGQTPQVFSPANPYSSASFTAALNKLLRATSG